MASCYFLPIRDKVCMLINMGIIPEVKLVPEAKPRNTNGRVVLFPLSILGPKHVLMARGMAEGHNI